MRDDDHDSNSYILGASEREFNRLDIQSVVFHDETLKTLKIAGIKPGMRCIDLGCGIGNVTRLMGSLVGRDGTVVGLDMNSEAIDIGNKKANEKTDYNNIKFVVGNVYDTQLDSSSFDFVFSRFLFQHLTEPKKAVGEMKRLASDNGGIISTMEADHETWISYPYDPHLENLRKSLVSLLCLSNSDPFIGRKLYKIFIDCDLKSLVRSYSVCIPMSRMPHNLMGVKMAEILKDNIIKSRLMSHDSFNSMLNGLTRYSHNTNNGIVSVVGFCVWAVKDN
jgi:ubiquinone/menaquinone biosynthesis C-methylase UbiE